MPGDIICTFSNICLVGDPVDVVTGANTDIIRDFLLTGPLPLDWRRHYDSLRNADFFSLGWGHTHSFDRWLRFDCDGLCYTSPVGKEIGFPPLLKDGDKFSTNGITLHRISFNKYEIYQHQQPTAAFEFLTSSSRAPLKYLREGDAVIEFLYDENLQLKEIIDSLGRRIKAYRRENGLLLQLKLLATNGKPERQIISYTYDTAGNLVKGLDPYGNSFTFAYDELNKMVKKIDRRRYSFNFEYDNNGRCVHSFGMDNLLDIHLDYMPEAGMTVVTQPDNNNWTYIYDEQGTIEKIIDPYGGIKSFPVDDEGKVIGEEDPNGNLTTWIRDEAGAIIGKLSPNGRFSPVPQPLNAVHFPLYHIATCPLDWEYGKIYIRESIVLPSPRDTVLKGLPTALKFYLTIHHEKPDGDNNGFVAGRLIQPYTAWQMDDFGHLVKMPGPDGTNRRWTYDLNGNVASYTDYEGSKYKRDYTSWNHVAREIDPLGGIINVTYTKTEQIESVTDPCGTKTEFTYDAKDRLEKVSRCNLVKDVYRYDSADNLVEKLDRKGQTLFWIEVGEGNLKSKCQLASGETYKYFYDQRGRLINVETDSFRVNFGYDEWGNKTFDKRNDLGVERRFDGFRLTSSAILNRFMVTYKYESGQKIIICDPLGYTHEFEALGKGLVVRRLSNNSSEFAQFNGAGNCLAKVLFSRKSSFQTWGRIFKYSPEGDLVKMEDDSYGSSTYRYDALHRLIEAAGPNSPPIFYRYDAAGNLLSKPDLEEVVIGTGNQLKKANDNIFDWNIRGHLELSRGPDGEKRYTYDSLGMLIACESEIEQWSAVYDPLGRRVAKSCVLGSWEYYWEQDRLAAEVGPNGHVRLYIYPDSVSLVPFMFIDYAGLDSPSTSGTPYYLHCDQIGTPVLVFDRELNPVWRARIDPYGYANIDPTSKIELALRFPGHYFDKELDLNYNRFRYYSPILGRYIQSDPLGIGGGINVYAYHPSPLTHVDVDGLGCTDDDITISDSQDSPPMESNIRFGPWQLSYVGQHGEIYANYVTRTPIPLRGIKIHVTVDPGDAEIVARSVLPRLRAMDVNHKVASNLNEYQSLHNSKERGKFVTIYANDMAEAQRITNAIDPELSSLRTYGGVEPGPVPTNRAQKHTEQETPIGQSGMLHYRPFVSGD